MTPKDVARSVEIASYEGEQATRAYAIKQAQDFRFWWRREYTKPQARERAAERGMVYHEAMKAMEGVVRLLDETRAARMAAKGLPDV